MLVGMKHVFMEMPFQKACIPTAYLIGGNTLLVLWRCFDEVLSARIVMSIAHLSIWGNLRYFP